MAYTMTNALRLVAARGVPFETARYAVGEEHLGAIEAARKLGVAPETLFKTLVARGDRTGVVVFCIPGNSALDLKKAARASHNKRVEMVRERELKELTGYIRGGCSPINMTHSYPIYLEEIGLGFDRIYVNGGERGLQILISPGDLVRLVQAEPADLV